MRSRPTGDSPFHKFSRERSWHARSAGTREEVRVNSTVSMSVVRGLLDAARLSGLEPSELLRAARLDPAWTSAKDGRMALSVFYGLCELAVELTHQPALGLRWAELMGEGALVPVSYLFAHTPTLRRSIQSLMEFQALFSDLLRVQLIEHSDTATLHVQLGLGESLPAQRFAAELISVGVSRSLRRFSEQARPACVHFEYAPPAYQADYASVFQCPVRFDQAFTGLVFARALLDVPAPSRDEDVHDLLHALAARRLERASRRTPYAVQVRNYLLRERRGQRTDMEAVARALNVSERSLRRHLSAEGKSYSEIAHEAFVSAAKQLLRDRRQTIRATANDVGYANVSAFHRAFLRLTGTTPGAYRSAPAER
jgi:AraC-like DNA-binding protein